MDDDIQLVMAARAGGRDAWADIYDRYADRLHDYCASVLRDRDEAADATHDTFVIASQRIAQLRDPAKLRPWLYAIARNEAFRRSRSRQRAAPTAEVTDVAATEAGPEDLVTGAEAASIVWEAAGGLSTRDRALLDLSVRQGLEGQELADAIGVAPSHAYVLLSRLRDQVERSLGALLIARQGRDDCDELRGLLADWDGTFSPLVRKRVARHVDGCDVCHERRRVLVSPAALLSATPLLVAPAALRDRVLDDVDRVSSTRPLRSRRRWRADGFPPAALASGARRRVLAAAVVVAVVATLVGLSAIPGGGDRRTLTVAAAASTTTTTVAGGEDAGETGTAAGKSPVADAQMTTTAGGSGGGGAPPAPPLAPTGPEGPAPAGPAPGAPPVGVADGGGGAPAVAPPPAGPPAAPPGGDGPGVAPAPPAPPGGLPAPPPGPPEGPAPPGPDPAHLVVEDTSLDLGGAASRATFGLANDGGSPAPWTASATPGWLSVSPASGVVGPGARTDVTVTIDRDAAPEGSLSGKVTVTMTGAIVGSVTVRAIDDRPPVIRSAGSDDGDLLVDGCGRETTTVRAVVSDGSGLERVVLTIEGPDGARTSRSMSSDGTEWSATLGPFSSAGTASWSVTATDRFGNLSRSKTVTVPVDACTRSPTDAPLTGAPR